MTMNDEEIIRNAIQWLKMLVSGKYVQGYESLKSETKDGKDAYCCLGIGAMAQGRPKDAVGWTDSILHNSEADRLGLVSGGGSNLDFGLPNLWTLNDRRDKSFKEITVILLNVPGYFKDKYFYPIREEAMKHGDLVELVERVADNLKANELTS